MELTRPQRHMTMIFKELVELGNGKPVPNVMIVRERFMHNSFIFEPARKHHQPHVFEHLCAETHTKSNSGFPHVLQAAAE